MPLPRHCQPHASHAERLILPTFRWHGSWVGLYPPPPPDLRNSETQKLFDGDLFYIIHNGIHFTGMPAFGDEDPAKDLDSWKLVHFIRHLLSLPVDELDEMKRINPKSPMQIQQEEEMRRLIESGENLQDCHNHRH